MRIIDITDNNIMSGSIRKIQLPNSETPISVVDDRVHIYRDVTGNPAITTGSVYNCTRWLVTDSTITAYEDGMICCLKVPISEDTIYGTGFQINSLGFKPVVWGANNPIKNRYEVNSVVWVTYNATQTAPIYINSTTEMTSTGCWQIMDHEPNDLPAVTSEDDGKILRVINGVWTLTNSSVIYVSNQSPQSTLGLDGDVFIQTT